MTLKLIKITLIASLLTLSACSTMKTAGPSRADLIVFPAATPVKVSYQDEVKLLKLNQLIVSQKKLTPTQKAVLLYQRGLVYDRIGLIGHAQLNFREAIDNDPTYAPAYNSIGVYWLSAKNYDQAFEAFDSALELDKKETFSYLHRAVGLVQIERYSLASQDIEKFYESKPNDPYRIIWRYLINAHLDEKTAQENLKLHSKPENDHRFIWAVIDLFAGDIGEGDVLQLSNVGVRSNREHAERLAEMYFYLGYWHREKGNLDKAIRYYQLTTATGIHDFIEYKYAYMELASIQNELMQAHEKKLAQQREEEKKEQ